MNCADYQKLFSPYLDGQVNGKQMRTLTRHMQECEKCAKEYAAIQRTQEMLAGLGKAKVPADLALRLRLAISRESAGRQRRRFEGVMVTAAKCYERVHGSGHCWSVERDIDVRTVAWFLCASAAIAGEQF